MQFHSIVVEGGGGEEGQQVTPYLYFVAFWKKSSFGESLMDFHFSR